MEAQVISSLVVTTLMMIGMVLVVWLVTRQGNRLVLGVLLLLEEIDV